MSVRIVWQALESAIIRRTGIIELVGQYELSGDRLSAVRRANGKIVSTTVASLDGNSGAGIDRKSIEAIISRLNFPFKFTLQVSMLNTAKLLDSMQTRRAANEIKLSKIAQSKKSKDSARANAIRRELELIEHDIRNMTSGSVPLRMLMLVSTSAASESRFYAEELAKSRIRELAGEFGALTNAQVRILSGSELAEALMLESVMI